MAFTGKTQWTDDLSQQVKRLWWDGATFEAIAFTLDVHSRDAVGAHIRKRGYQRNPGFSPTAAQRAMARVRLAGETLNPLVRERRARAKLRNEPEPKLREDGSPVTLENARADECRWIHDGEGHSWSPMCGSRTVEGESFCPHHAGRAFEIDLSHATAKREHKRAELFAAEHHV
jgi:hypothetical protein